MIFLCKIASLWENSCRSSQCFGLRLGIAVTVCCSDGWPNGNLFDHVQDIQDTCNDAEDEIALAAIVHSEDSESVSTSSTSALLFCGQRGFFSKGDQSQCWRSWPCWCIPLNSWVSVAETNMFQKCYVNHIKPQARRSWFTIFSCIIMKVYQ